jgi:hypothetical protein
MKIKWRMSLICNLEINLNDIKVCHYSR